MRPAAAFREGEMSLMVRTPVPCWPQGKRFCRAVPPRTVFVHFQRAFRACAATDILVAGAGFPVPARVRICCIAFPSQKGMTACSALVRGYGAPADSSAVPDRTSISNRERLSPWGCVRSVPFISARHICCHLPAPATHCGYPRRGPRPRYGKTSCPPLHRANA